MKAVASLFPHFGETVLMELLKNHKKALENLWEAVIKIKAPAFTKEEFLEAEVLNPGEIRLILKTKAQTFSFDPFQRLDLALLVGKTKVLPFEIKLGTTKPSQAKIDELCGTCTPQKTDPAILTGNMLAVLNRKYPVTEFEILAEVPGKPEPLHLTDEWILLSLSSTTTSWEKACQNGGAISVGLTEVMSGIEPDDFNKLVGDLLKVDFYKLWINLP